MKRLSYAFHTCANGDSRCYSHSCTTGLSILSRALKGKGVHTWIGMLGYCQKDKMMPHYQSFVKNVTPEVRDCLDHDDGTCNISNCEI